MYAKPSGTRMSTPTTRSTSSGAGNPTKGRRPAPAPPDQLKQARRPLLKTSSTFAHQITMLIFSACSLHLFLLKKPSISSSIIWDNTGNGGGDKQHHTRTIPT